MFTIFHFYTRLDCWQIGVAEQRSILGTMSTPIDFKTQQIVNSIMSIIELAYSQRRTVTWRTIFVFLNFPPAAWENDDDLDDPIQVYNESDLVIMRASLTSHFAVKH